MIHAPFSRQYTPDRARQKGPESASKRDQYGLYAQRELERTRGEIEHEDKRSPACDAILVVAMEGSLKPQALFK